MVKDQNLQLFMLSRSTQRKSVVVSLLKRYVGKTNPVAFSFCCIFLTFRFGAYAYILFY